MADPPPIETIPRLLERGVLREGVAYGKAELVRVLAGELGERAASSLFRRGVRGRVGATSGGVRVERRGVRRGAKYLFVRCGEADAESVPKVAAPEPTGGVEILRGDNLPILRGMPPARYRLIYIDPPFNTGRAQARTRLSTVRDEAGDRVGYKGARYRTTVHETRAFADSFADYLGFLAPRLREAHRLLAADGSLFVHLDYREVHHVKVLLDRIFGRACFQNEIIWAYDYGGRTRKRWPAKHDNILWYSRDPGAFVFNYEAMERVPYMAPGLVGPEKAARGKTPTDVWWHTIVSPTGREKTGYPTQKPLGVLERIVGVHSQPGDALLDFFAGSGSFGEAGAGAGRRVTLVDESDEAIAVMRARLAGYLGRGGA